MRAFAFLDGGPHLLVYDNLGVAVRRILEGPQPRRASRLRRLPLTLPLFAFIRQKYLGGSLIVTSNLAFAEWTEVFGEARLTSALLDRLTHRCHILEFAGESYRFRLCRKRHPASADELSKS